jgi:3-hydroxyisobutyrate dehydrogenase-like beta-hydroxyacid dehydrogenase
MANIGFIGLGMMGAPMASRLMDAGHRLTVWNRTRAKAEPLEMRGAEVATTASQAAAGNEFVITMLATPDALEDVIDQIVGALTPGQIVIDMSTVGPAAIQEISLRLPRGVELVDAPVRGSIKQAETGTLDVMIGADDATFARVRPVLEAFGTVRHAGARGTGAAMKLVANLALGGLMATLGEALALGRSMSLPLDGMLDMLEESTLGPTVKSKRAYIESGHYPPNFHLTLAEKDMRLVQEAAEHAGADVRTSRAARSWMQESIAHGAGDFDYSAMLATIMGDKPAG